jgi:hypothetical protein
MKIERFEPFKPKSNLTNIRASNLARIELKRLSLDTGLKIPRIIDMWTKSPQAKQLIKTKLQIHKWTNKGQMVFSNVWITLLLMAVIGIVFLLYFFFSLFAPVGVDLISEGTNLLSGIATSQNDTVSQSAATSVGIVSGITNSIEIVSYISFFLILIFFLILAFNVSTHQWLIGVWIIFIIILTGMGIVLSNAYQDFSTGLLSPEYKAWTMNDYIMRYYPYIIASFGFILGFLLFIIGFKPVDNSYMEGGYYAN